MYACTYVCMYVSLYYKYRIRFYFCNFLPFSITFIGRNKKKHKKNTEIVCKYEQFQFLIKSTILCLHTYIHMYICTYIYNNYY